ncbi:OB-fold-containig protein [Pararhodonellum marinum]|uniref:OB-fold-containig protein n=1 Tax=Pararhodonellum marinum TaxID=2755358 RepID=UPI00188EBD22|nr:OB-fold-containig protein [Pararhodonellum marinum]
MERLIEISFAPANFILTLLAIIILIYWLVIIFTGFDLDLAEADADINNPEVGSADGQGFWSAVLEFLYIGELPIMFILSIVIFCMWLINVNVTALLGISDSLLGFLVYVPGLVISMLITKVVARPFVKLYGHFNHKGEEAIDFIGKTGKVISPMGKEKIGQVEISIENDVIRIYAKSIDGDFILFNDTVIILEESSDKKYFLAQKYQL